MSEEERMGQQGAAADGMRDGVPDAVEAMAGEGAQGAPAAHEAAQEAATATAEPPAHPRLAELEFQVAELERQVAKEREAATDYMNRWQRAQADFANLKRRTQQDEQQHEAIAAWRALAAMLPALDGMERAFATLPEALRSYSWIDGIALVHIQMSRALATMGITPVAAEPGQPFNPARHEAIGEVETAEHPAGTIAVIVQRGYETGGVLLRPALVQVARQAQASQAQSETVQMPEESSAAQPEGVSAAEAVPGKEGGEEVGEAT